MVAVPILLSLASALDDGSLVVRPLHLGESPPPVRSVRHILLGYRDAVGASGDEATTREGALALAAELVARARRGVDFAQLAAEHSDDPNAHRGAVLGSFAPKVLAPALDKFLFTADPGEISEPIVDERGVHILQRIETHAAVLQILIRGEGSEARARCEALVTRLRSGADFSELAREHSDDRESAARGGQLAIYERGVKDTLLKSASFRMAIGEILGPLESPIGWHVLKRVPIGEVDPSLAEPTFVRVRGILLRLDESSAIHGEHAHAAELALDLFHRIRDGEDMRSLAREFDEDPGGKEREGDLGWIHRGQPGLSRELRRACLLPVGQVAEPARTVAGYLLLRRER